MENNFLDLEDKINLIYDYLYNLNTKNCFSFDKISLGKISIDDIKITIPEENNDLEYPFSIEKLLNFLIDQKIPLTKGVVTDGYNTKIIKTNEANRPCWVVKWLITPDKLEILTIDGETGKVIDREYMEYENS